MRLAFALIIVLFAAGCRQKTERSAAPAASPAVAVQASPDKGQSSFSETPSTREQASPSAAASATAPIATATDLAELTQALRKYSFEHQRVPKTFNEVVAAGYVKDIPQAPPGRKFGIDPKTVQVVLVKQ